MTEPAPAQEFSPRSTLQIARAACLAVGLPAAEVELLRLGENAVYCVDRASVVIRIGRSLAKLDDARKEIRVARWLDSEGYPAVRLAAQTGADALVVDEQYPVTFWCLVRSSETSPTEADLGRLLHDLHTLPVPGWLNLPDFSPFTRVPERLQQAPAAVSAHHAAFLSELLDELQHRYAELEYVFPSGPIHGDAHVANLIRDEAGEVLLLDFECVAHGQPEWDLTVTGARREGFEWMSPERYRLFANAYGFDILKWPGFPVLRAIRELTMTTWLMQLVGDPAADAEFRRRVEDIRVGRFPRQWSPF